MENKGFWKTVLEAVSGITKSVAPQLVCKGIYNAIFKRHFYVDKYLHYEMSDYPDLCRSSHHFKNSQNQKLQGYLYEIPSKNKIGFIILCHGFGGGGHICYLDIINHFAENGFYVFAYDATANDESEGNDLRGFPQGYLDACKAIDYAKKLPEAKKFGILLFGHSWGSYSALRASNHTKEIKAVVGMSGFNSSIDLMEQMGNKYAGKANEEVLPAVYAYEKHLFGQNNIKTASESLNEFKGGVLIVHSEDDPVVPFDAGYKIFESYFSVRPEFEFIKFKDRGHGTVYLDYDAIQITNEFAKKYNKFIKNKDITEEQKFEFIKNNVDRKFYANRLNKILFEQVINFYKKYL